MSKMNAPAVLAANVVPRYASDARIGCLDTQGVPTMVRRFSASALLSASSVLSASLLSTSLVSSAVLVALIGIGAPAFASAQSKPAAAPTKQTTASVKKAPANKQAKRSGKKAAEAAPDADVAAADEKQLLAVKEVHLGDSACEFGHKIQLDANSMHPGYVDLSFNKKKYTMKPVMSATGALRLEDVRSETLLIQIANKSMVMNQKTGQRLVDNCQHANQKTVTAGSQGLMK